MVTPNQTDNIVGNFRVSIGGVIITFNVMDNPETIVADLAKANAICDNVLSNLGAPPTVRLVAPIVVAQPSTAEIGAIAKQVTATAKPNIKGGKQAEVTVIKEVEPVVVAHAAAVLPETAQPVAEVVEVVEAEPVYTLADMRKLLSEIIDLGHRPAAEQYVQYHCKTKRTSEISVEKYPAIMKDLAALADGLRSKNINSYDDFAKVMGYELSTDGQE